MGDRKRILVVDDMQDNILILHRLLHNEYQIHGATNGVDALRIALSVESPDLILLDVMMPDMNGYEVCQHLKKNPVTRNVPVIFLTALDEEADEARGLALGAVDYITKPIRGSIVKARIKAHMKLHLYQEELEEMVRQRTEELREGYIDTIRRLTLAAEYHDEDTGGHLRRISRYTQTIARQMGLDRKFAETIFYASPMHDVGKVAIPSSILKKTGPLNETEWKIMKDHTVIGARILKGSRSPYLRMAFHIARSHHERWNGSGYPEGLQGETIPMAARIMNICDQYDALRSNRPYKQPFDHEKAFAILTEGDGRTSPDHFDPKVLEAFRQKAETFARIFAEHENE